MKAVSSRDGSTIAFDDLGAGSPLVLLPGALCTRGVTRPLADLLAATHRVINVDRRGRGDSGDASGDPWATAREVEDVAALLDMTGPAAIYGHSSGAGLAVRCAVAGLPISRLVVHDAPYNLEDSQVGEAQQYHRRLLSLLRDGQNEKAVAMFLAGVGMPPDSLTEVARDLAPVAPSLAYDSSAIGDDTGGLAPLTALAMLSVPTTVLAGTAGPEFFTQVAEQIAAVVPGAAYMPLVGLGHDAGADVVAPALRAALE